VKTDKNTVEQMMRANNLNLCLECGKCSSLCPMIDFYGHYDYDRSTRGVVERIFFEPENIDDEDLWYCLACEECSFFCPSGVNFQGFMRPPCVFLLQLRRVPDAQESI